MNVTQDNLYLLLPSKVSHLAVMLAEDSGSSLTQAVEQVYASALYRDLEREDTKLWHLGPVDLYRAMREE